jgi:hypothetical protein
MAVKRLEVGSEYARPLKVEDQVFHDSKAEPHYLDRVPSPSDMAENVVGQKLFCKTPSFRVSSCANILTCRGRCRKSGIQRRMMYRRLPLCLAVCRAVIPLC